MAMESGKAEHDRREDMLAGPHGGLPVTKVDHYGWTVVDEPGEFRFIDKQLLQVDKTYQREKVSEARVNRIASHWSWMACGCLIVVERDDGTLWIDDGQHRKLAADKRSDIPLLPCLVFHASSLKAEARGFTDINTVRGNVCTFDRFRALVVAGDSIACAVKEMVEASGYRINPGRAGSERGAVSCISALTIAYQKDPALAPKIWRLAAEIAAGDAVDNRLFSGLFYLEARLQKINTHGRAHLSIFTEENQDRLVSAGWDEIRKRMDVPVRYIRESGRGAGGARAWAEGIVGLLNYKRRGRRLPSVLSPTPDEAELNNDF